IAQIKGKLTLDGGEQFETAGDKLVTHNQQGSVHEGTLTADHLMGFGLGAGTVNHKTFDGVEYQDLEFVDLRLSDNLMQPDTLTVESTHLGDTRVVLGAGDDIINVKTIGGRLGILGGAGDDIANVHDNASTLGAIGSRLTFDGDA